VTRRLRIEWSRGRKVDALLQVGGGPGILLAHGAGAPQRHPFMVGMRRRLAAAGLTVMTFDYPYSAEGRKAPDRMPRLLECHRAALDRIRGYAPQVVLAGKSMGGRMASHLSAEAPEGVVGLVVYGYPLVSPSSGEERDTAHFGAITVPALLLSGDRDRLGPVDALRRLERRSPAVTLEIVEGADHSFRRERFLPLLSEATVAWLRREGLRKAAGGRTGR
jgi:predicted alpha/beta-hydrolase family hydrolase